MIMKWVISMHFEKMPIKCICSVSRMEVKRIWPGMLIPVWWANGPFALRNWTLESFTFHRGVIKARAESRVTARICGCDFTCLVTYVRKCAGRLRILPVQAKPVLQIDRILQNIPIQVGIPTRKPQRIARGPAPNDRIVVPCPEVHQPGVGIVQPAGKAERLEAGIGVAGDGAPPSSAVRSSEIRLD